MREPGEPIRVFITDDHFLVREGLRQLFKIVPEFEVVGEAQDGAQLLERLDAGGTDLLLLDMRMPGLAGEALIARVRSLHPRLPILVLSSLEDLPVVEAALRAGANGYIGKDRDPEALLAAMRRVARGALHVDARIGRAPARDGAGEVALPDDRPAPRRNECAAAASDGRRQESMQWRSEDGNRREDQG